MLISHVLKKPYDEFTVVPCVQLAWEELLARRGELDWDRAFTLKFE